MTPGVTYQPGDWCLCVSQNDGWVRINTLSSGGGGGGASSLGELLDVTLAGATDGQYLQLQADGQWKNVTLTADVESVNGQTGVVVLSAADVGALAPGDNVSELVNDSGFITRCGHPPIPENTSDLTNDSGFITSADLPTVGDGTITIKKSDGTEVGSFTVNQSGNTDIALPADVVPSAPGDGQLTIKDGDGNELGVFTANQATGTDTEVELTAAAVGALAPGDDISELNNDAGYITAGDIPAAPVTSVNGETGDVVLEASDVGALPDTTPLDFVPLGSWASIPVLT